VDQVTGPAVEAAGLVKTYRSGKSTVEAVRGVDLRVDAGEVFGFLGPNGAGKSTTVRMLTTLLTITGGSVRVAGVDVAAHPDTVRRKIGVALQEAGLDNRQTGRELLVLQGRLFGLSASEAAQRAEVMEFVRGWYVRHVALDSGRSSTWTSGLGIARMVRACVDPGGSELWPASIMLEGEYAVDGVSLSVPVRLGGGAGARGIEEWELSDEELAGLRDAAAFVREAADSL